jgi:16S rRNA (uracil1498-N3)-methyltransferase
MRISRLYINQTFTAEAEIVLAKDATHYLVNVLRLRVGAELVLFNGQGGEYTARLIVVDKKYTKLQLLEYHDIERESSLELTLVQAISRPEHMNYTIQKAVELGVTRIVPLISKRSPPIDKSKIHKREQQWQKIIISACEQSGRNRLPILDEVQTFSTYLAEKTQLEHCIVLAPEAKHSISKLAIDKKITILIGAEGGLTDEEIQEAIEAGYLDVGLGSRILRTETAAIAMLALCQGFWGDLTNNPH